MTSAEQIQFEFEKHGIKRVKIGGFDIDGILRGKYISLEKFWSVVEGGMGFCDVIFGWDSADQLYDRSVVTGWHTGYPDIGARIDLDTLRLVPWEPGTVSFLLDFTDTQGAPMPVSPRQVLKRAIERAESLGFSLQMSIEFEFFIYEETPWSMKEKGYRNARPISPGMFGYSWLRTSQSSDMVRELIDACAEFDVPIEGFHTETGPGVFEAALRYTGALAAADRAALFKTAAKEICHRHGRMACFMAKPANGLPGCSGHSHQSLWDTAGENSLFFDESDPLKLSKLGRHYLAGQVALMPDLTAIMAPTINSYKRLLDANWAPSAATWGVENRTCALRLIPGTAKSTRIEHRLPGADVNPYLAFAAMIHAGLYGIEKELELPPQTSGNAYASDAPPLPMSLHASLECLDRSEIARALLGDTFVDHFVMTRRWEVRQFEKAVTDWDLSRYFELV